MKKLIKVPTIIKIVGYFHIFISVFVFPVAVGFISELQGTEKIIIGMFFFILFLLGILMGYGMIKGNVRALKVFYYLNKINLFYFYVNQRIKEFIDEVETKELSEELKNNFNSMGKKF